jgi:peptidoglycan/xylan/chitin deacetylase (PgdA/CDA1 family)
MSNRELVGYGADPPDPKWPNGARLALNFVLNYEEGGENTPLEGDPASEAFLHEVVGAPATIGRRNLNTESMFEYGSRAGFWRVHRIFGKHGLPLTVYAVGQALERNPAAAQAMVAAGWEVASHGWRWIDYMEMPEDEERAHIRHAIGAIERATGARPGRLVHGQDLGQHPPPRGRGGRVPLRLGLLCGRAALLGRGVGAAAPRDPVHARRERLQVPARERVRDRQ